MIKLPLDEIEAGDVVATDVRVHSESPDLQYRVRLDRGTALTGKHLNRLAREGVGYLFIRDKDLDDLDPFIYDQDVEAAEEEVTLRIQKIGKDIKTGANMKMSIRKLRESLDDLIAAIKGTDALLAFSSLKAHNDYTAKHSLDVARFSIHLLLSHQSELRRMLQSQSGASHKYTNRYMLEDLGLGALLHDLGKWTIPVDVLTKSSRLNDREWQAMKHHPEHGAEMLNDQERDLRAPVKMPALQHHERFGGGGYPLDLEGEDIHLYGRICTLCDVYSALTSDRPYRVRKTPNRARQIMRSMQKKNEHFDPDLLDKFMDCFPPFPIGQQVVLSNGTRGVVSRLDGNPDQPVVRVLFEGNNRLDEPYELQANTETSPEIVN